MSASTATALRSAALDQIRLTGAITASSPQLVARYDFESTTSPGLDTSVEDISHTATGTDSVVHTFLGNRTHTVTATHSSGATATLQVKAIVADFPETTALQNTLRYWEHNEATTDPSLDFSAGVGLRLGARENHAPGKFRFRLYPDHGGKSGIAARLSSGGPIVAIARVSTVSFSDALQNDLTEIRSAGAFPGYNVISTPVVVTDLPPGGKVKISIFKAGVTFLDGTTVKYFTEADFIDGILKLQFLFPVSTPGGYCHYVDIIDADGKVLGRR